MYGDAWHYHAGLLYTVFKLRDMPTWCRRLVASYFARDSSLPSCSYACRASVNISAASSCAHASNRGSGRLGRGGWSFGLACRPCRKYQPLPYIPEFCSPFDAVVEWIKQAHHSVTIDPPLPTCYGPDAAASLPASRPA